jgi:hypothetical protein
MQVVETALGGQRAALVEECVGEIDPVDPAGRPDRTRRRQRRRAGAAAHVEHPLTRAQRRPFDRGGPHRVPQQRGQFGELHLCGVEHGAEIHGHAATLRC